MDWDDLRVFLAVARHGSQSAAARALKVEGSTVGRRIAALEHALGSKLFERAADGFTLTTAGSAIHSAAVAMEEAAHDVGRRAAGEVGVVDGTVRVAATEGLATTVILPALAPLAAAHPGVHVEILAGTSTVSLLKRDADIAVRSIPPEQGSLVVRRLGRVCWSVYASPSYLAEGGLPLPPFDGHRVIAFGEELASFRAAQWLRDNASGATPGVTCNNPAVMYAACAAGLGLAVLPELMVDDARVTVVTPDVVSLDVWLVVHPDVHRAPRVRAVVEAIVESAAVNLRR